MSMSASFCEGSDPSRFHEHVMDGVPRSVVPLSRVMGLSFPVGFGVSGAKGWKGHSR